MRYACYGLSIASDLPLPELVPAPSGQTMPAEVRVVRGPVAAGGLRQGRQLGPYLWTAPRQLWLQVPGIARFLVSDGQLITIDAAPGIDESSIRVFLLGSALGALLFQRGLLVLHGNAIQIGDQCLVCVGPSGAGKSTLAAGFLQRGYAILADDVVPVDAHCCALAGFPRLKLWQDTADRLRIDTNQLCRVRPAMAKFNYPLTQRFSGAPLPIRWVYILGTHQQPDTRFEAIHGMDRFNPLRNNTYRVRYMEGMALKPAHLQICSTLAGRIHLKRITRPERGFGLDELVDRILADIATHP